LAVWACAPASLQLGIAVHRLATPLVAHGSAISCSTGQPPLADKQCHPQNIYIRDVTFLVFADLVALLI